jgi:hypothetical protein
VNWPRNFELKDLLPNLSNEPKTLVSTSALDPRVQLLDPDEPSQNRGNILHPKYVDSLAVGSST